MVWLLQIFLPAALYIGLVEDVPLYAYILVYSVIYLLFAVLTSLLAYKLFNYRRDPYGNIKRCRDSLPDLKTNGAVLFHILTAMLSGAGMALLSHSDYYRGFALMLMTPLHMNVYFAKAPYESSLFDYENDQVGFFSTKYARPGYIWILTVISIAVGVENKAPLTLALLLPLFFSLGWISNPFVTLVYALE